MKFDYDVLDGSKLENITGIQYLGYPRTEAYSNKLKIDKALYRQHVRQNMINMDDPEVSEEIKNNVEFVLNLTDPESTKLDIRLTQNITRAKEQKALRDKIIAKEKEEGTYDSRIDTNVLILYLDNLSRAHFYRKLPETSAWLEQFHKEESDLQLNQFFRYHSVYYNTLWTNNAMYYGQVQDIDNSSVNVFDKYSKNGYITGFSKDA